MNDLLLPVFSAGLGAWSGEADPDAQARASLHCDLLVIGAGAAGLAAALTAARAGARVVLAGEDFRLGDRLLAKSDPPDEAPASCWRVPCAPAPTAGRRCPWRSRRTASQRGPNCLG